ncbi:hypothetical protein [Pseudomonas sp. C9-3]|uniref:hypothetical protein n=1 Tax=Pseudomonas sp. C9-3 TaxID=3078264 RepID=UPI0028E97019|nr:hypothetical protein [Pseudomonas sp. C9-3]
MTSKTLKPSIENHLLKLTTAIQQAALVAINNADSSAQNVCPVRGGVTIAGVEFRMQTLNNLMNMQLVNLVRTKSTREFNTYFKLTERGRRLVQLLPSNLKKPTKSIPDGYLTLTAALRVAGATEHSARKIIALMKKQHLLRRHICDVYIQKYHYSLTLEGKKYGKNLPNHLRTRSNPVFHPTKIESLLSRLGVKYKNTNNSVNLRSR